jgi:hypothetical protein
LKSTTDKILKGLHGGLKRMTAGTSGADDVAGETEKSLTETKSDAKKKSTKKDEEDEDEDGDIDDDDDTDTNNSTGEDVADDDEKKSTKHKKSSSKKSKPHEASLGVKPSVEEDDEDDDVKATSSCAPVQLQSKHGIYRQYNKACMEGSGDVLGCDEKTSEGCQSCFLENSPAATQSSSYSRCSHHVCSTYGVEGCDPEPTKATSVDDEENEEDDDDGDEDAVDAAPTVVRAKSTLGVTSVGNMEEENCLPNLEDAKRGIFQYSERYCRTLGHIDVDYAGCIAVGKSTCRMCATRSARGASSVFALCPRSVCESHDLLFEQCEKHD